MWIKSKAKKIATLLEIFGLDAFQSRAEVRKRSIGRTRVGSVCLDEEVQVLSKAWLVSVVARGK
jgi:hypothetical protein